MRTHMLISFILVIFVASSTTAQRSNHTHNKHGLSVAIEEMEKANYFSFVMLINMLPSTNPKLLANITFLMPKDRTLTKSNIIHQDSVTAFLLRHSIPSPLSFDHLNLFPNGSVVPSSLPHYTLKISNGGRSNYYLNNVKIISRDICNLGSIRCHGIDGILQSLPSTIEDDPPQNNHTSPTISCPINHNNSDEHNSHNNSDQNDQYNSSRPAPTPTPIPTPTALPPTSSPTRLPKSDSFSIRDGEMSTLLVLGILGLLLGGIGM